jgi:hypothetical protein
MNGGSGECEGMSVDGDGSGGMGIDVDVDKSKKNMVFGDECKDGTGFGDTGCDDRDILRGMGVDYEVIPLAYGQ